jgi:hypothetical protein
LAIGYCLSAIGYWPFIPPVPPLNSL